jgi:hypothetical protein
VRKTIALLSGAALAALGIVAVAFAAQTASLEVKASPNKASKSKSKLQAIRLEINVGIDDDTGASPSPLTKAVIRFNEGGTFNGKLFPKCKFSELQTRGPSACPRGSKVGSGTATATARPVINLVNATVTVFNGEAKGGKPTVLLYNVPDISSPITVQGTVEKKSPSACGDGGRCDYTLTFDVPPIPTLPGQPNASVLTVRTKTSNVFVKKKKRVRGKRRTVKIPYIAAPRKCTGKWVAEGSFSFENGQTITTDTSTTCRK